ncbi:MAG TPA: arylesterase [Geobacteraceae bacterium]
MPPYSALRSLAAVFLLFCTFAGGCSPTTALPALPADAVVLAFGDSITYGTGAAAQESYPAVLAVLINRRVVNAGVPGEITSEGLARLPEVLDREKPALLILCHGGNDILRHLDERQTAENLRAMVRLARERGIAVVLLGVPAFSLSLTPPPFYREVATETGIPFDGKSLPRILGKGSLKSDYIHPNAAGYRELAQAVAKLLRKNGALPS